MNIISFIINFKNEYKYRKLKDTLNNNNLTLYEKHNNIENFITNIYVI